MFSDLVMSTPLRLVVSGWEDCMRFLISEDIVTNAVSTLIELFAEVSKNGMPNESAYSFAVPWSTAFFTTKSVLFPTRSLLTLSVAYFSISLSHVFTLWKVSTSVTSYTMIIPWAPL
eukprot:gene10782-biopygen10796